MIELSEYLELKEIGRRAFYYQLEQKKIFKKEIGGVTFVIDPELELSDDTKLALKEQVNRELGLLAIKAHAYRPKDLAEGKRFRCKEINKIVAQMVETVNAWKKRGVKLRGWSKAACYRKIEDTSNLKRQRRSDIFANKNPQLANPAVYEKFKSLYYLQYDNNKAERPSLRTICERMIMYAQKREEFYEIASIPFSTVYDNVRKLNDRFAHSLVHQAKNNLSHLMKNRVYVEGAFTADMGFMEWYAMDDHVMEVDGALVYNKVKDEWEKRKVYLWTVIECKTFYPIAYHIQTDNFNSDDIKLLMLKALMNTGRPVKGILMDNGLASSKKCQEFLNRLGIVHDSGKAYDWMHKAVQERIFGFVKNEFCTEWNNYIGGGRSEVRHTGEKMSPELCDYTIDEFISKFDDYMEGFYQRKPRSRTDNYEKIEISIREDFENRYLYYEPQYLDPVKLRSAFMVSKVAYMSLQHLSLGNFGVYTVDLDNLLDPVLQERNYLCTYIPLDLSEIDIYAMEDILIQKTGEMILKGERVATLYRMREKMPEAKRKDVAILNNKNLKLIRAYAENTVNIAIAENFSSFSPELNEKGQLTDTRKLLTEKTISIMKDAEFKAKEVIIPEQKKRGRKASEEIAELSHEEIENIDAILKSGDYE